jgi:hypothetical protein
MYEPVTPVRRTCTVGPAWQSERLTARQCVDRPRAFVVGLDSQVGRGGGAIMSAMADTWDAARVEATPVDVGSPLWPDEVSQA